MKKIFTITILILISKISLAQAGSTVRLNSIINVTECNSDGTSILPNSTIFTIPSSLVKIYTQNDTVTVFYFLFWGKIKGDSIKINNLYNFNTFNSRLTTAVTSKVSLRTTQQNIKYFKVSTSIFKAHTAELESKFSIGYLTIPFKIRLNEFDFSSNVQLGIGGAVKVYGNSHIVGSIGVSSVSLDSINCRKITKASDAVKDITTFTFGVGYMYKFKNAQALVLVGFDFLSSTNQNKYEWKSNGFGAPWLGFGIGFSIFNTDKDGDKNK